VDKLGMSINLYKRKNIKRKEHNF